MPHRFADAVRPSSLPMPRGAVLGVLLALLAVIVVAVFSYRSAAAQADAAAAVFRTLTIIQRLEAVVSTVKDAEIGQRSYLLTNDDRHLEIYSRALATLPTRLQELEVLLAEDPEQLSRARLLTSLVAARLDFAERTVQAYRNNERANAIDLVRSGRGFALTAQARTLASDMETAEQRLLERRQAEWGAASRMSSWAAWGGSAVLFLLIGVAAAVISRDFQSRETESWIRAGQMGLTTELQGEQRIDVLGERTLNFLVARLNANVGAIYLAEPDGRLRRIAGHALSADAVDAIRPGDGLTGQVARDLRARRLTDVPPGYLPVSSATGTSSPRELLIGPAAVDGRLQAVVELGFFRRLRRADIDLLDRVSETLAVAVRSSNDRTRLEELLEETQRQAEELQSQQEELRVANEELEEQSRALRESQSQLETQQAELEQINSNLEEQTQLLEAQKDVLTRAEVSLKEKAAELERANQYKSEFLANMSHELRTPLNSSLILASLLADNKHGNLTDEQVSFAKTIHSAGQDLLALINDILDLSKIESGKLELTVAPMPVAASIESVAQGFAPLAKSKGLAFEWTVDPAVPESIATDSQRVGQILKNLLSNAIKFTDRGSVSLKVNAAGPERVAFAVTDSGIGIPPQQQEVIFEAFRQADGSTHRKYGGTGLGLSISRELAHLLGGEVGVVSTPGKGSTFTLTIPVTYTARPAVGSAPAAAVAMPSRASAPPPPAAAAAPPTVDSPRRPAPRAAGAAVHDDRDALTPGTRRVLIVEDDVRFAAILRDLAHEKGFQCLVAHSATEGLALVGEHAPSGILLDINLPDHSGLAVLDQLKRNPRTRHIPVHVLSVADHSEQALARGAIGYAIKPVNRAGLLEAFQRLESRIAQGRRRVLVVEDDRVQRESVRHLLESDDVEIVAVETAAEARTHLRDSTFDCVVMDLKLPDQSGFDLLEQLAAADDASFPPVIVYTGRSLTSDEEQRLRRFSRSIIIKDARSPERLLDEVTLFLHQVEDSLPAERQRMLKAARARDAALEGRRILVVEDDARNIFALSHVLEPHGATVDVARNGREAIDLLARTGAGRGGIDLVLMDIMMPEMDGLTATREIRRRPEWKRLPIIALTAKAMRDDQEKCLAAGANDYIAKPFDVDTLLSLVRVWMPK